MFLKFAIRDSLLLIVCLLCWRLDIEWLAQGKSGWSMIGLQVVTGLITLLVSFIVHEWGHLLGALLTRSKVYAPHRLFELFLFHFDSRLNNARQFIAMSVGGFVASGLVTASVLAYAPLHSLGGVLALIFVALGVLATIVLEFPTTWRVLRGGPLPSGFVYEPFETGNVAGA